MAASSLHGHDVNRGMIMFKKIALALSAAALVAIPATADARGRHHRSYSSYGYSSYGYAYPSYGYSNYGYGYPSYGYSNYGYGYPSSGYSNYGYGYPAYGYGSNYY